MGLTISVNNNKESSEKYKILDNEETLTKTIIEPVTKTLTETESMTTVNDSKNTNNFQCPNQHLNCKNQRCWW